MDLAALDARLLAHEHRIELLEDTIEALVNSLRVWYRAMRSRARIAFR